MCLFWWQHFMLSCRLSIDKNTLSRPSHQRFFCHPPKFWGARDQTQPGSLLSRSGGRTQRETLGTRLTSKIFQGEQIAIPGNNMQYAGSFMNTTAKQFGEKIQHAFLTILRRSYQKKSATKTHKDGWH